LYHKVPTEVANQRLPKLAQLTEAATTLFPYARILRTVEEAVENTVPPFIRPFLLMEGGPLYSLQKWLGLAKENAPRIKRRASIAALLTFFPLLILSALQHRAFSHVDVPFVRDFSTYSRFLFAVPLLLLAENILGPRIATAAAHFIEAGLVTEKDYVRFAGFIDRGLRSRDSILAEVILATLAYVLVIVGNKEMAIHASTWYITRTDAGTSFTWAGVWLFGFCAPLFQFLTYRWLYRLFLWFQFLHRVNKLDLQLFPTHPDEAGGLGFVGETQRFFGIILFALSIGTAGVLANSIVYDKVPLQNFTAAIGTYVVVAIIIIVLPLIVFSGRLLRTKRIGLHQYGSLATAYTGLFQRKWIGHYNPENEPLLGSADIQSLADLGNSFSFIEKMKPLPIDVKTLLHLAVASLLPMVPLLLAVMPLKDLLKLIFKVLM
jgi:hypothetical protein